MNINDILAKCDHTLLRVDCTGEEIRALCDQGIRYNCASVCIPPCHVAGAKLVLTVLARELSLTDEPDDNAVSLTGTLCKAPNARVTPLGRDICDLLLAVNRRGGRSDYLPCICWGSRAREAAQWTVGTVLHLEGRFQSREYLKLSGDGLIRRTAYEVSAARIEALT